MSGSPSCPKLCIASSAAKTTRDHDRNQFNPEAFMSKYPVPNLRRDLPISVVLLIASLAAVVPRAATALIALAAFGSLMVFRFSLLSRLARVLPGATRRQVSWRSLAACREA